ncbi:MAG TPA: ORF6N domain-containing protein [Chitinophagaceae bacterium]|nr:ORF6N domain-containing protein [Chitinophagaceae bacterium]
MKPNIIQQGIFDIRGEKVIQDFDLAKLYGVQTRVLNQAVKRNPDKFSRLFMFRLTGKEWKMMRSQNVIASKLNATKSSSKPLVTQKKRNIAVTPYAFTEHGVTMAATVLKSRKAIKMSIVIIKAFIELKKFFLQQNELAAQLRELRQELFGRLREHDVQLAAIYDTIERLLDDSIEEKIKWEERRRIGFRGK